MVNRGRKESGRRQLGHGQTGKELEYHAGEFGLHPAEKLGRKMKPDIFVSFVSTERQKSDSGLSNGESLSY